MNESVQLLAKRLNGLLIKRPGLTVGIWGEAGIGKTHTVSSLLLETPCRNVSVHATLPVAELVLRLPQSKKLPVWAERILERINSGQFVEPSSVIDLLGAVLSALAPIIVHVEDLHEANQDSLEFVQALAALVKRLKGVGLLVTSRTLPPEEFEAIRLEARSGEDVRVMLEAEAGSGLPSECLDWIQARAAGNPLYTLEFFRFLTRQGFVWNDGKHWHWRVPDRVVLPVTVEALIEQRLQQAAASATLEVILAAKALLPLGASESLWATAADVPLEEVLVARAAFERQGLLIAGEFAHPLYREVARQNLAGGQQTQIAKRVVQALEYKPELAASFALEVALEAEVMFGLFVRAASQAEALGASLRSARWKAQAALIKKDETTWELALDAADGLGDHDPIMALQLVRQVLEVRPNEVRALLLEAVLLAQQKQGDQALAVLDRLPDQVKYGPQGLETRFNVLGLLSRFEEIIWFWQQYPGPQHRKAIVGALNSQGRTEEAIVLAEQALRTPEPSGWARLQLMAELADCYRWAGVYEKTDAITSQLIEVLIAEHHARRVYVIYCTRCMGRHEAGQFVTAFADAKESLRYASEAGDLDGIALGHSLMGSCLTAFAEHLQAEDHLTQARVLQERQSPSPHLVDTEIGLSELYRNWTSLPHAAVLSLKHARNALRYARATQSQSALILALHCSSIAEAFFGQPQTATAQIQELEDLADISEDNKYFVFWAKGHASEKCNQPEEALKMFQTAHRLCSELNYARQAKLIELEVVRLNQNLEQARALLCWSQEHGWQHGVQTIQTHFPSLNQSGLPEISNQTTDRTANQASKPDTKLAQLEVLGTMRFNATPIKGRKRQELLAMLLEARIAKRNETGRLDLLDWLYPDTIETQASSSLKETVRGIRASFGADVIQTTPNGYALGNISSDAEQFLQTAATHLWRGTYLEGLTLETNDETVRESLHLALLAQAKTLLEADTAEVARLGKILLAFDAYNLEHLELNLLALQSRNNYKSLAQLYSQVRIEVGGVGEMLPERWQDFLSARASMLAAN